MNQEEFNDFMTSRLQMVSVTKGLLRGLLLEIEVQSILSGKTLMTDTLIEKLKEELAK